MKVVVVCQKGEFDEKRAALVRKRAPVVWIDKDFVDLRSIPELFDSEEKILALSPVPIKWVFPDGLYLKLRNVRYLCIPTTSSEFLNMPRLIRRGIQVTYVPHYATDSVAEQALLMLLALSKKIPAQIKSHFAYEFSEAIIGDDLREKVAGIIGLGDIGTRVAELCDGIGMKVQYWSPHTIDKRFSRFESIDDLLKTSDVIFPFVAANDQTFGFLDKKKLSLIKDTAYYITLVDDRISDKPYLLERAKSGSIGGFAFESSEEDMSRYKGNVLVLPPFAWYSRQSLDRNIQIWTENIISCIHKRPKNVIT